MTSQGPRYVHHGINHATRLKYIYANVIGKSLIKSGLLAATVAQATLNCIGQTFLIRRGGPMARRVLPPILSYLVYIDHMVVTGEL